MRARNWNTTCSKAAFKSNYVFCNRFYQPITSTRALSCQCMGPVKYCDSVGKALSTPRWLFHGRVVSDRPQCFGSC